MAGIGAVAPFTTLGIWSAYLPQPTSMALQVSEQLVPPHDLETQLSTDSGNSSIKSASVLTADASGTGSGLPSSKNDCAISSCALAIVTRASAKNRIFGCTLPGSLGPQLRPFGLRPRQVVGDMISKHCCHNTPRTHSCAGGSPIAHNREANSTAARSCPTRIL